MIVRSEERGHQKSGFHPSGCDSRISHFAYTETVRQYIASVDLPVETFEPHTGTQTSILIVIAYQYHKI